MIVPKVSCIVLFGSDAGNLGWLCQVDEEGINFCSLALVSLVPSQWGYMSVGSMLATLHCIYRLALSQRGYMSMASIFALLL